MEAYPKDAKEEKTGPGAIFSHMSGQEIRELLEKNLNSLSNVKGVNNHMGSKISEDENILAVLFNLLKEKKLFYLDSLVTNKSVARTIGKKVGIKLYSRDVFLDNIDDPIYIEGQIRQLVDIAILHGTAVGIGHVERKNTAKVIVKMLPFIKSKGIEIVHLSEIASTASTRSATVR